MKLWIEKILAAFLLINFVGICGFWTFFLFKPSEPITLELFLYFSIGVLFYASLQATGWAISNKMYPFLFLMLLNIVLIGIYMLFSTSNGKTASNRR